MPAPADLQPQTPGESPATPAIEQGAAQQPAEQSPPPAAESQPTHEQEAERLARGEMMTLINGNLPELIASLGKWTPDQLQQLRELEALAKNRSTALNAIDAELAKHNGQPPAAEEAAAPAVSGPVRTDTQPAPVLTDAGWVVPEPTPKA
ncbi:hypothetical protein ATCM_03000 [Stenotrophomonas sp. ATCM1_4]|uniref:hypothetical protein n=1 Tax=Stenotrophomonas sp. ATCM1_4 TaxID=2259330 RepID=UPI00104BD50A|nr:hypothetical protein [Stenotrophomonas sp. ATCM1_4]TDB26702.1 hypothetical protein ATCM_03000 [Stenotrophomonas sp. ATCM1_4]